VHSTAWLCCCGLPARVSRCRLQSGRRAHRVCLWTRRDGFIVARIDLGGTYLVTYSYGARFDLCSCGFGGGLYNGGARVSLS
jgi:hypothetical protein